MEVRILDLVNPKHMMSPKGFEFWETHGLQKIWEENGMIKIIHRCQHLDINNLCSIEQDKPDFCRDWVCRRHLQDSRWFQERENQMAKETLNKVMWAFFGAEDENPISTKEIIKSLLIDHTNNIKALKEVQMPMYGANHGPQAPPPPEVKRPPIQLVKTIAEEKTMESRPFRLKEPYVPNPDEPNSAYTKEQMQMIMDYQKKKRLATDSNPDPIDVETVPAPLLEPEIVEDDNE